jgi:hypothetical protein
MSQDVVKYCSSLKPVLLIWGPINFRKYPLHCIFRDWNFPTPLREAKDEEQQSERADGNHTDSIANGQRRQSNQRKKDSRFLIEGPSFSSDFLGGSFKGAEAAVVVLESFSFVAGFFACSGSTASC